MGILHHTHAEPRERANNTSPPRQSIMRLISLAPIKHSDTVRVQLKALLNSPVEQSQQCLAFVYVRYSADTIPLGNSNSYNHRVTTGDSVPPPLAAALLTVPLKAFSQMSGPQGTLLCPTYKHASACLFLLQLISVKDTFITLSSLPVNLIQQVSKTFRKRDFHSIGIFPCQHFFTLR